MIDGEWYILVANPDYDDCDIGQGDAAEALQLLTSTSMAESCHVWLRSVKLKSHGEQPVVGGYTSMI